MNTFVLKQTEQQHKRRSLSVENEHKKIHIYLYASESENSILSQVLLNINSIIKFTLSLAFAKYRLKINLIPHIIYNLFSNIYLSLKISARNKVQIILLHKISHY